MVRETWSEILAYFLNYVTNMQPVLAQTRKFLLDLHPEDLMNREILDTFVQEEEKRSVHKVKAISEFTSMYRREIITMIVNYVEESKESFDPKDIKDFALDFFDDCTDALKIMESITNPDQANLGKTVLYQLVNYISEVLLPQGKSMKEIFDKLVEQSKEYYDVQRHILKPTTAFREELELNEIPGINTNTYRIINEITSLFNLDPNYIEDPDNKERDIPVIMKDSVFEPFVDSIANSEEEAINKILNRMELRLIDGIFIGPTARFIELTESHNYITNKKIEANRTKIMPQFSNETLVLLYLANVSYKRGFISKELINWISSNVAWLIYNSILELKVTKDNIFYHIFVDLKTEEKILPYLMKLICFDSYLRIDRTQIRDSIQYRKEVFNSLGSQIAGLDKLTKAAAQFLDGFLQEMTAQSKIKK
jgi:hypothetical protein